MISDRLNLPSPKIDNSSAILQVTKFSTIITTLLPIFENYPLLTSKALDFLKFKEAIKIKSSETDLTLSDKNRNEILALKQGMNLAKIKNDDYNLKFPINNLIINSY
jgi:hypothetical protein